MRRRAVWRGRLNAGILRERATGDAHCPVPALGDSPGWAELAATGTGQWLSQETNGGDVGVLVRQMALQ